MERVTEQQRQEALSVLRKHYWQDVRDVIEDLKGELKRGAVEHDTESVDSWIHEAVDGHERIIYTWQAVETLLVSDSEDAYESETGQKGSFEVMAFYAFKTDILEEIGDVDALIAELEEKEEEQASE